MTSCEIASFIERLMRRELRSGELASLTTRDLNDINSYLAEYIRHHLPERPQPARRTYSEAEILEDFLVTD